MPTSAPPSGEARPRSVKADVLAGFLVFLIALPLSLGIAMASGFPPISGIITAVVGGMVVSFLGSARLTIKGPAAGLIVIAYGAVQELGGGDLTLGYRRALAVGFVAAVIQVVLALMKAGALGDMFPSSVVHGMLAAIGVIIVGKQVHVVMGVTPESGETLELLAQVPSSLMHAEPEIFLIGGISLLILLGMPMLPWERVKKFPAPLVVLLVSIPLALVFDLSHAHHYTLWGIDHEIGPRFLVSLPARITDAVVFPDFSVITSGASLKYVVMFALVGSIESLLSVKAVDSLDPAHHESNLNKDLFATGIGNMLAALLGGLPMISEIVRSKANIDSGARSHWANFSHGAFLLLFVAGLPFVLTKIPLAALGAMLVYTGLRLGSPTEFVKTYRIGSEQLLVFVTTFVVTLATDLLLGVGAGIVIKILIHIKNGASPRSLFKPTLDIETDTEGMRIRVRGSAIFTNYLGLRKQLDVAREKGLPVVLDFEHADLVDHTVMEKIEHLVNEGRRIEIAKSATERKKLSAHPLSAHLKSR
ncbi:MAG: SulP family inorganic anion transporter [Deltaproteobacteria bacterium]|nr:MAG: SulP family inorganic anion transporter [Deltaproteobacteria bacterium]